ncbi:glucokinase [Virgisporangium aliadipatigenens]|uniref:Glucokinase n=1 Tax=Virgisporangium aliadipatigenens TaxID=741659 RepID=A0A8J3YMK3_9ACTN|nr:ROK family protein [Virgisporangium aliadipatigenens]GIJ46493.1 glucokinase [Virgisporangium aliadipatigenens]
MTVLGIDFGGTKVALATAPATESSTVDGGSALRDTVRLPTLAAAGAAQLVERALAAARTLTGRPTAVGVSTFGVVSQGRIRLAPNVPGWDGLELPRLLREEFGQAPVVVHNDVNAAATAELRWGALRGVDLGVYLNLGTGIGGALIVGGRVLTGAHGAAGEIGYLLGPDPTRCFATGHAPLEELASGGALTARSARLLRRDVTASQLFDLADDPDIAALLDPAVDALAAAVANLCIAVDPQRVVIGGGMMAAARHLLPRIAALAARAVPFPPEIRAARFVHDAPLRGALALALDAAVTG